MEALPCPQGASKLKSFLRTTAFVRGRLSAASPRAYDVQLATLLKQYWNR